MTMHGQNTRSSTTERDVNTQWKRLGQLVAYHHAGLLSTYHTASVAETQHLGTPQNVQAGLICHANRAFRGRCDITACMVDGNKPCSLPMLAVPPEAAAA